MTMKNLLLKGALALGVSSLPMLSPATDLDLYTNVNSSVATDLPNVLFIIDNTANWNQAFTNEMAALANTLHNLPENKFNVGIMLATESGGGNGGEKSGGYIRAAIRTMNSTNKAKYEALVNSFDKLADKGNSGASGVSMAEAYAYFAGQAPYSGNQKVKADYTGNTSGTASSTGVYALPGNALASFGATAYRSPVGLGSCAKNYVIYISNGPNQQSSNLDSVANSLLSAAAGGSTAGAAAIAQIPLTPSGSQSNPIDEWTRFMKASPYQITTYSIDVDPGTNGQGPGWTALLKSMSGESNYKAVSSNGSAAITGAVNDILSKIQSVNSVFAAVSLPASANVQGAYLNQLYVGVFRPDPDAKPRWLGNLKQFQLGSASTLVDADTNEAINDQTGFIAECARSFWTPSKANPDSYWANDMKGKCIPPGTDANLYARSNTPDGNIVEKGGAAYVERAKQPANRNVKTCSTSDCTALAAFSSSTVSTSALGAADSTERDALINWAIGSNIDAELAKTTTEMRPSSHGDVIHSNPLALSYGTDVVVFYGSNDGMLHAINGNKTASTGSYGPGEELWAFMPTEFYSSVKRLRDNSTLVSLTPPVGGSATGAAKPFGMDGPITAYKTSSAAWIFAGMRRGGRALYAFDVTTPSSPSLKWKIGCSSSADTSCTTGTTGMGQTWSSPLVVRASGYGNGASPLLLMGGGYDGCEDADQNTCTSASKGNKIYAIDADTGAILATLNTDRGVVGDIKVVPGPRGYAKYAYATDLGGNVYRINIDTLAPSSWTIVKIASLGCPTAALCPVNRKFMFGPSIVVEGQDVYSLYVGTGDREKPLGPAYFPNTAAVNDYFFKIKDKPNDATWLAAEAVSNCPGKSLICLASLTSAGSTAGHCGINTGTATSSTDSKGWLLSLRATEKVVTPAATRFGITTFSTHMPAVSVPGSCASNLGTTHVYNLSVTNAAPAAGSTCNDVVAGGGLPPPPEKLDVCMNDACTIKESICLGCTTASPIQVKKIGNPGNALKANAKRRVYWYLQK
jgi:type IV pilus assembly protein PilY1